MKRCGNCKVEKPISDFYSEKRAPDGLYSVCKPCHYLRTERWRRANRARINEKARTRWASDPANSDRQRRYKKLNKVRLAARDAEYFQANKDRFAQRQRNWWKTNPERARLFREAWRAANPDRLRASRRNSEARRRAMKAQVLAAPFTLRQLAARMSMFGGKCWICRKSEWEHVDHVKPLSKGGAHILANLRPACEPCNRSKAARWPYTPYGESP